jgi:hypothetical protein
MTGSVVVLGLSSMMGCGSPECLHRFEVQVGVLGNLRRPLTASTHGNPGSQNISDAETTTLGSSRVPTKTVVMPGMVSTSFTCAFR